MKRIIAVPLLLFLSLLLLIGLGLGFIAHFATPFVIEVEGAQAKVDVSTVGEYPTSVSRIRLSEGDSGRVLWELASGHEVPQIWDFTLRLGLNPVELGLDGRLGARPARVFRRTDFPNRPAGRRSLPRSG